jgi:signal transduction histidine kinase
LSATIIRNSARAEYHRDQRREAGFPTVEESLRRRSKLLEQTLEQIDEGISVFDREGRLVAWNSHFVELLDLPSDLSEGIELAEILWIQARRGDFGPVDCDEAVRKRIEAFFEDVPTARERITPTGRILEIRRHILDDGAAVTRYADVTEQKIAEVKRAQASAEADFANRAKTEFLAHMSHELRTPLNAIIGFSELICEGLICPVLDKKSLEYIGDIHSSGLLLLAIVNDVLDMSKIESGKLELLFEQVAVQRVIAETIPIVSKLAHSRGLEIVFNAPQEDITIVADERALKQIVLNLVSNAIKFSNEGGRVEIGTAIHETKGLLLSIEDRGIGMTSEELERALQPFAQAKPTTTRTHGGTGLGLPIVKGLVDAHGGNLIIESTPGEGTIVRVMLPPQPGGNLPFLVHRHGSADEPNVERGS